MLHLLQAHRHTEFLSIYRRRHPSIKHAFFSSHPLAQNGTDIQAHTYHADSDRTPSPGWARFPFSGSSRPLFVAPSCAWDCAVIPTCSHVDVDRTVAATSRTDDAVPFLLPLLPVSLLRGGAAKELPQMTAVKLLHKQKARFPRLLLSSKSSCPLPVLR